MAFPTLTRNPTYPLSEETEDMVIRDSSEAGYEATRPRFTKRRRIWTLNYERMSDTDLSSLESFFAGDAAYGSGIFSWTNPVNSTAYNVRMTPPKKETVFIGQTNVSFQLKEA